MTAFSLPPLPLPLRGEACPVSLPPPLDVKSTVARQSEIKRECRNKKGRRQEKRDWNDDKGLEDTNARESDSNDEKKLKGTEAMKRDSKAAQQRKGTHPTKRHCTGINVLQRFLFHPSLFPFGGRPAPPRCLLPWIWRGTVARQSGIRKDWRN